MEKQHCVYILTTTENTILYTGITNNLKRRVSEHRRSDGSTFTGRFKIHKLVYYEIIGEINAAKSREKQIKAGSRQKRIDLINSLNPDWRDLYDEI